MSGEEAGLSCAIKKEAGLFCGAVDFIFSVTMEDDRVKEIIVIRGTQKSLGIEIVGGKQDSDFGIFVKKVIPNRPVYKDGRLKRGDQLLEVNGRSLLGVSNARAVEILKNCALTNEVSITISRDQKSRKDFRRLSDSLLLEPLPQSVLPQATSTPLADTPSDSDDTISGEAAGGGGGRGHVRRPSSSSDFTNVSNIGSHEDDLEDDVVYHISPGILHDGPLTLSDVKVDLNQPPPVPSSPPPSLDASGNSNSLQKSRMHKYKVQLDDPPVMGRFSPDGRDMTPLTQSAGISIPDTRSFVFPKNMGLGVLVSGGIGRERGPYIVIEKILEGMDAAKDGNLKTGDRLISINGEDFCNISREKALTLLTSIKQNPIVDNYNVVIERVHERSGTLVAPPTSLPSPIRADNAIFNSDTLLASEAKKSTSPADQSSSTTPSVKVTVPLRSKKMDLEYQGSQDKHRHDSMQNRLSMDPNSRCKLDKMEWALKYIGYTVTPEQQKHIRSSLVVDQHGKVIFAEFVKLAQDMFAFRLDDTRVQTKFMLALADRSDSAMPPFPKKATSYEDIWDPNFRASSVKMAGSQPLLPLALSSGSIKSDAEMELLRQTLHQTGLQKEKEKLEIERRFRAELEKEKRLTSHLKEELEKKDHESAMKTRQVSKEILIKTTEMTEDAFKSERERANLLEDSIRKLTAELEVLKGHHPDMSFEDTQKRLAVIDNELRKEKLMTRRYQVATERLMQFVEDCHEALVNSPDTDRIMYHPHGKGISVQRGNAVTGNPRPPQYLSKHAKMTCTTLAKEAKDTMLSVRKMLEAESLPFGWEEAYNKEGKKYFMNHETQTTSWVHPRARLTSHSRSRSATPSVSSQQLPPSPAHRASPF